MGTLGAYIVAGACLGALGCGTTIVQYVQPPAVTVHATLSLRAPEPAPAPESVAARDDRDDDRDDGTPAVRSPRVIHLGYGYQMDPRPAVHVYVPAQCCDGCRVCTPAHVFTPSDGWSAGAGGWVALPDADAPR